MRWWISLLLLAVACGVPERADAAGEPFPAPEAQRLETVLRRALEDRTPPDRLRIVAEGAVTDGVRAVTLYGTGVGIWNGRTQFRVPRTVVLKAVRALLDARFPRMPQGLGEGGDSPVRIVRSLTVAVGDLEWSVFERWKGSRRPALGRLLQELAGLCREAAARGITPTGLPDALRRLRSGELAPEVLRLTVNAARIPGSEGPHPLGWRLEIRHGHVGGARQLAGGGWTALRPRRLRTAEAASLAEALARASFWELPPSLHWDGYCHVTVEVLGHRHSVLARRFSGPLAARTAAAARTFTPLFRALEERFRAAAEPAATPPSH